jgi:hypothetical protein
VHQQVVIFGLWGLSLHEINDRQLTYLRLFFFKPDISIEHTLYPFKPHIRNHDSIQLIITFFLVEPQPKTGYLHYLPNFLDKCLTIAHLVNGPLNHFLDSRPHCLLKLLVDALGNLDCFCFHVLVYGLVAVVEEEVIAAVDYAKQRWGGG